MIMTFKQRKVKFKPRIKLNHNIYINSEKREARARNKIQGRPISFEEKHEDFIAAVRK